MTVIRNQSWPDEVGKAVLLATQKDIKDVLWARGSQSSAKKNPQRFSQSERQVQLTTPLHNTFAKLPTTVSNLTIVLPKPLFRGFF